jgi:hypothetical protein
MKQSTRYNVYGPQFISYEICILQGTELFSNFLKLQVNGTNVQVFAQTFSNLISGRLLIGVLKDITSKRVGTYTRINGFNYHDDHHVEWRNLCLS